MPLSINFIHLIKQKVWQTCDSHCLACNTKLFIESYGNQIVLQVLVPRWIPRLLQSVNPYHRHLSNVIPAQGKRVNIFLKPFNVLCNTSKHDWVGRQTDNTRTTYLSSKNPFNSVHSEGLLMDQTCPQYKQRTSTRI